MKTPASINKNKERDALFFHDLCPFTTMEYEYCSTFGQKVGTQGLYLACQEYLARIDGYRLHLDSLPTDRNVSAVNATLYTEEFDFLRIMEDRFMHDGFEAAYEMDFEEEIGILDSKQSFNMAMMLVFVAILILIYFIFYHPLIDNMDRQMKRTRGMLLLIPVEVLEEVPSLRKAFIETKF